MRFWYERYAVWVALTVFILVSIVSLVGFSPTHQLLQMMCSQADKGDCFRQWASATSGWFGGAVTLATLIVLSRQISDVRNHHRETMLHATRPTYLRAMRLKDAVSFARITLKLLADAITRVDQNGETMEGFFSIMSCIKSLNEELSRPEFDNFENDIGYIGIGSAFAVRSGLRTIVELGNVAVEMAKHDLNRKIDSAAFEDFKAKASYQKYTELYFDGISAEADKYIQYWETTSGVAVMR
ncbi:hypothetical protein GR215_21150 [Rhizobium leguminosarum]|uniref:hypothetical protein n=1 Tax=Rhizobium leguminosarum TaxID=384 RepID=UPI0013BA2E6F|nr:hypothetical protein [Rhizobium leguminosarum]NEH44361.1 hypothetical protein [Rhizobium leguminosarum]